VLDTGDQAPLEATVIATTVETVTLADLVAKSPILLLFYLWDWTGT
jgi:peroxiredoxin